jgi:hypothetical protein
MSAGAFSIDQLMELAGLSVSQAGSSFFIPPHHQPKAPSEIQQYIVFTLQVEDGEF